MHVELLVAEIGSTTTVVNAFSIERPALPAQGSAPTTVLAGDVRVGLREAIARCAHALRRCPHNSREREQGPDGHKPAEPEELPLSWDRFFATSSAAGGLRMTVHGLVYDMTVKAAREAALGAGANLLQITAGRLRDSDLDEMVAIRPNIVLIAGGVDYGERDTALVNARLIAEALEAHELHPPVLYAGNIENRSELQRLFDRTEIELTCVDNVYPRIDELNAEPCRREIQRLFEQHITRAPGMAQVRELVDGRVLPTPGAVMEAAKLLQSEIGDLIVFDVGGATTDLHSVAGGSPEIAAIATAPEPFAKRTVEGDLGLYLNRRNLVEAYGSERLCAALGTNRGELEELIERSGPLPLNEMETRLAQELTVGAATRALGRHAGSIRNLYGPTGRFQIAEGKDLTAVRAVIGTGGALTRLPGGAELLRRVLQNGTGGRHGPALLPPADSEILIDREYIMAALGAIAQDYPETARSLLVQTAAPESPPVERDR